MLVNSALSKVSRSSRCQCWKGSHPAEAYSWCAQLQTRVQKSVVSEADQSKIAVSRFTSSMRLPPAWHSKQCLENEAATRDRSPFPRRRRKKTRLPQGKRLGNPLVQIVGQPANRLMSNPRHCIKLMYKSPKMRGWGDARCEPGDGHAGALLPQLKLAGCYCHAY